MRKWIAVFSGIVVLAAINWVIYQREQLLVGGRVVLLELAPVDPRSLMQGDYMALRFKVVTDAFPSRGIEQAGGGYIVVMLDQRRVGAFKRFHDGTQIAPSEILLRYRIRAGEPKFATNAFFFQEGHASYYAQARYGEFRVARNGDMILTALRGTDLNVLGPPRS